MASFFDLLRRAVLGSERALTEAALDADAAREPLSNEELLYQHIDSIARQGEPGIVLGSFAEEREVELAFPVRELIGVHRWSTGATGSGKSAQVLAEELQLIGPGAPWSLLHLDAKSESAPWLTEIFLPAMVQQWNEEEQLAFLTTFQVVSPFDPYNVPSLNILRPVAGVPAGIQAREVATLIGEALGPQAGSWGPRMTNVLFYALRLALELRELSLLEVRSFLVNDAYLTNLLRFSKDRDVREYFIHRYPSENKEAIRAVVSRLDLLLMEGTAEVLCARECLDFGDLLESPLSVIDVGGPPRGAEYLGAWWLGVFVRGLARAIMGRPDGRRPAFCVLDEWWTALDLELASHFERLLSLARHKRVGLWLLNQLPGQVGSRSPALLATIKNACGLQIAFRQSFEDAKQMGYMLPTSAHVRVKKDLDGPDWDTRRMKPEEQRRLHVSELTRLQNRTFWLYPKMFGFEAVKLVSPTVPFEEAEHLARRAPEWIRRGCRGHVLGNKQSDLTEVLEKRRAHIDLVAAGRANTPGPDWTAPPAVVPEKRRVPIEPVAKRRADPPVPDRKRPPPVVVPEKRRAHTEPLAEGRANPPVPDRTRPPAVVVPEKRRAHTEPLAEGRANTPAPDGARPPAIVVAESAKVPDSTIREPPAAVGQQEEPAQAGEVKKDTPAEKRRRSPRKKGNRDDPFLG